MLLHHKPNLILGGDWNCITENKEYTNFPDQKKSPTLKRLINLHNLKETYETLHPKNNEFSRYYTSKYSSSGATRLDRIYISKHQTITYARYIPNPFLSIIVSEKNTKKLLSSSHVFALKNEMQIITRL